MASSHIALSLYDVALEDSSHFPVHLSVFGLRLLFYLRDQHLSEVNQQLIEYAGPSALESLLLNYLRWGAVCDNPCTHMRVTCPLNPIPIPTQAEERSMHPGGICLHGDTVQSRRQQEEAGGDWRHQGVDDMDTNHQR